MRKEKKNEESEAERDDALETLRDELRKLKVAFRPTAETIPNLGSRSLICFLPELSYSINWDYLF